MARDDGLFLDAGNFNRVTPGKFVDVFREEHLEKNSGG